MPTPQGTIGHLTRPHASPFIQHSSPLHHTGSLDQAPAHAARADAWPGTPRASRRSSRQHASRPDNTGRGWTRVPASIRAHLAIATTRARALSGKAARRVWASAAAEAGVWAPSSTTRGAWLPLWEAEVCITCRAPAGVEFLVGVPLQAWQLRQVQPAVWRLQCGLGQVQHTASGLVHTNARPAQSHRMLLRAGPGCSAAVTRIPSAWLHARQLLCPQRP